MCATVPTRGVPTVDARHEDDQAIGLAGGEHGGAGGIGFDGDRDRHVRQDDAIVERQQGEKEFRLYRHVRKCSLAASTGRG